LEPGLVILLTVAIVLASTISGYRTVNQRIHTCSLLHAVIMLKSQLGYLSNGELGSQSAAQKSARPLQVVNEFFRRMLKIE
jgi:hypothetical protein